MTDSTRLPSPLHAWVESVLGPMDGVRDASHARDNSQVWRVAGHAGDHYVKVAPKPILYTRETRAYRAVVPHLGQGNAPALHDSSAELLALILTAVDGEPLKEGESPARRRVAHRQAGQLLHRFHDAMTGPLVQPEATRVVENTVAGLDKHLAEAGDHLSAAEADTLQRLVSALPDCGPLPAGWRHGDFWERNLLWNGRRCALIDFERSEPGPLVADFVKLATSLWPGHPELRTALFEGYGRPLSETEERALTAFAAADAASALAYGPRHGDPLVTARGRRTVECLVQEGRL
ncbi:aminoglycoside phosphotransferase family protein [Streptomyces sp. NBC_01762]|uniref:aminoglycoside phosphotransferase family protein n=1 Tax=unclassified Streptomyces TaxID=2593676 RepID=UPI002DDC42EB|nr:MULTISPECIES: aminoglycoside phosphotransferase family protein [unclassified Streptomyces]WSC49577.1 aminoglycoside phosphotransferase family protein [Streptomyces sp. NBC_01762]WSD29151.1 aminoglycoside phosphotransferase family protein [Streptomyces sp. NBC_01751]